MKINIVGAGFVGLTLASVLSQLKHIEKVTILDVDEDKIKKLIDGKVYVHEEGLVLNSKVHYTTKIEETDGDIYFICVGTPNVKRKDSKGMVHYIQDSKYLEGAVTDIVKHNKKATIIVKSTTLPENISKLCDLIDPLFTRLYTNPEFLAEGTAINDMKHQVRLVIGADKKFKDEARELLCSIFKDTYNVSYVTGLGEAMIVKYFMNSYKAQKINFFNQFNSYCKNNSFSFKEVLDVVSTDKVLGEGFDKPGVGFGGSCFPKDTAAMGANLNVCKAIHLINEVGIEDFINSVDLSKCKLVLIGGKAFKNGTNDIRESVSVKVVNEWKSIYKNVKFYYYDQLPELSDLTLTDIADNKNLFDAVIIFNDLPELLDALEGVDECKIINTRKVN